MIWLQWHKRILMICLAVLAQCRSVIDRHWPGQSCYITMSLHMRARGKNITAHPWWSVFWLLPSERLMHPKRGRSDSRDTRVSLLALVNNDLSRRIPYVTRTCGHPRRLTGPADVLRSVITSRLMWFRFTRHSLIALHRTGEKSSLFSFSLLLLHNRSARKLSSFILKLFLLFLAKHVSRFQFRAQRTTSTVKHVF